MLVFLSYRSLTVVGTTGYRLFALSAVDRVDELFCSHNEDTKIAERLFSSSLVAVVTTAEPTKLKVCKISSIMSMKSKLTFQPFHKGVSF